MHANFSGASLKVKKIVPILSVLFLAACTGGEPWWHVVDWNSRDKKVQPATTYTAAAEQNRKSRALQPIRQDYSDWSGQQGQGRPLTAPATPVMAQQLPPAMPAQPMPSYPQAQQYPAGPNGYPNLANVPVQPPSMSAGYERDMMRQEMEGDRYQASRIQQASSWSNYSGTMQAASPQGYDMYGDAYRQNRQMWDGRWTDEYSRDRAAADIYGRGGQVMPQAQQMPYPYPYTNLQNIMQQPPVPPHDAPMAQQGMPWKSTSGGMQPMQPVQMPPAVVDTYSKYMNQSAPYTSGQNFVPSAPNGNGYYYPNGWQTNAQWPQQQPPQMQPQAQQYIPQPYYPNFGLNKQPEPPAPAVASTAQGGARMLPEYAAANALATIYFDNNSSELKSEDRLIIKQVADWAKAQPGTLRIIGHASSRTKNMDSARHAMKSYGISLDRAEAVAKQLEKYGVPRGKIVVKALSDREQSFAESVPMGEDWNRRVEIYSDSTGSAGQQRLY